jgi:outer membrane lipoprotein-sorting protein
MRFFIWNNRYRIPLFFVLSILLTLSSCRTTKTVVSDEIKPMSAERIMRKVEKEAPKYNNFSAKRLTVTLNSNGEKNSVSGQLKIKRNEKIIASVKKIIPVGKAMVTRDSVIMINYLERDYIAEEITLMQQLIGIDLNFDLAQMLFTADLGSITSDELLDRDLVAVIDSQMYRIDTEFNRKIKQALSKSSDRRMNRNKKRMDDSEFMNLSVWIDPEYYVLRKVQINDIKNDRLLMIRYDDFQLVKRNLFPQKISLAYYDQSNKIEIDLEMSKLSINDENDFSFSIPDKFSRTRLRKK